MTDDGLYEQWLTEDRDRRLKQFHDRRPAAFAAKGRLDARVHAWLQTLADGQARTLVLGGATGTGKSWSTWKAVETLIDNGLRIGWEIVSAYELSRMIAPPIDEDRLDRLAQVHFLAIDDLASIKLTDWAAAHLLGLVDHRWSRRLPMLIATNEPELGAIVGERIASRLSDGATYVSLDGTDRRRAS